MNTRSQESMSSGSTKPIQPPLSSQGGQYLTLGLGSEEYAINILCVQEIRSFEEPTRMVNAPHFIKGVINLRGVIVPIMDLRLKLNLPSVAYSESTVVIILNMGSTVVGVVVDSVSDVVTLSPDAIKPAPQFDLAIDERFIVGLAQQTDRMLVVMNIEVLISDGEMRLVR